MGDRHTVIIAIKGETLPYLGWGKERATKERASISIHNIIGITIPWPPADYASRRLKAALGDRVTSEREDEEKN